MTEEEEKTIHLIREGYELYFTTYCVPSHQKDYNTTKVAYTQSTIDCTCPRCLDAHERARPIQISMPRPNAKFAKMYQDEANAIMEHKAKMRKKNNVNGR